MDVGRFKGLYTGLIFDYRLRLWAATSASHAVSVVAELLVFQGQSSRSNVTKI